jgi:hypothetical protein
VVALTHFSGRSLAAARLQECRAHSHSHHRFVFFKKKRKKKRHQLTMVSSMKAYKIDERV